MKAPRPRKREPATAFHEPSEEPQGFGLRQSAGAMALGPPSRKRQRTAAVQDAGAPNRFRVPIRDQQVVAATRYSAIATHHCFQASLEVLITNPFNAEFFDERLDFLAQQSVQLVLEFVQRRMGVNFRI